MKSLISGYLVASMAMALAASVVAEEGQVDPAAANDAASNAPKAKLPLDIYANAEDEGEILYIPSGWMGNYDALQYDDACADKPHSGASCIKVSYDAEGKWAGIVWQDPANDWGDEPGGYDLTGAKKLSFWARGD